MDVIDPHAIDLQIFDVGRFEGWRIFGLPPAGEGAPGDGEVGMAADRLEPMEGYLFKRKVNFHSRIGRGQEICPPVDRCLPRAEDCGPHVNRRRVGSFR